MGKIKDAMIDQMNADVFEVTKVNGVRFSIIETGRDVRHIEMAFRAFPPLFLWVKTVKYKDYYFSVTGGYCANDICRYEAISICDISGFDIEKENAENSWDYQFVPSPDAGSAKGELLDSNGKTWEFTNLPLSVILEMLNSGQIKSLNIRMV